MPKVCYVHKDFNKSSLERIAQCNTIIREYQQQGFKLTLRQLYYQLVSRGLIPNRVQSYKNLGSIVNDARLAGLIDWNAIEDRTRNLRSLGDWDSPQSIVSACAEQFRLDLWDDQDDYVEVWIEKDALVGVIEGVCNNNRVPFFACRGYTSQSEMWGAGQRFRAIEVYRNVHVIHLGDHDPSGIDMTRDIQERLRMFGSKAEITRIALNMDQVEEYSPPPNPAKTTDARYTSYEAEYGDESWELDALEPRVIADLIQDEILKWLDADRWDESLARENLAKKQLRLVSDKWDKVVKHLKCKE